MSPRLQKSLKTLTSGGVVAFGMFAFSSNASAFHSGSVAECDGCHTMHNSLDGDPMTVNALPVGTTNDYLLKGADASSTCLACHGQTGASSYHIFTPDADATNPSAPVYNLTPGGDFQWLKKTYSWVPRTGAATETEDGETHGHNVIAADFGLVADGRLATAPGGLYDANQLTCISCHDPHGKYRILNSSGAVATSGEATFGSGSYNNANDPKLSGSTNVAVGVYRLLGGIGYAPKSYGTFAFTAPPPTAVAPSSYNRSEATTETRVAYGAGMSEWCANCHTNMHNDNYPTTLRHPAGDGALMTTVMANYNAYVKSGDMSGSAPYSSLVPFEEGTTRTPGGTAKAQRAAIKSHAVTNGSNTTGATADSNVMCLSCHRAHASGWRSMMRWNMENEFLTVDGAYPLTTTSPAAAMGRTQAEIQKAYYDRPATAFAPYQRSLCNKCHAKD